MKYDVIVIGGGPGGYVCAIKAAQLGMKVACVEMRKELGGTCLNEGCIPSKALLHSSHLYYEVNNNLAQHGINISGDIKLDLSTMMSRKSKLVKELCNGINFLFKSNKVDKITGYGSIKDSNTVLVQTDDGEKSLSTKYIVIATGSVTANLPGVKIDEEQILSSTGALELKTVPKSLAVIGGGVIGLEMGSVWSRLGSEVTVIEYCDKIIPNMDNDISIAMTKSLKKQGIKFSLSTKVNTIEKSGESIKIECDKESFTVEKVLVAIGRKPNTDNFNVKKDHRGFIQVNDRYETSVPGVFAIGDAIPGPMLAHKAEEEGVAVAEILTGKSPHVGYIPAVIYTHPEVASIGYTEQELKEKGIKYKVGKFPFAANSRAKAVGDTEGFVKIIVDQYDTILGGHIFGPQAGTLIGELGVAMEYGASSEDIARICHSHPDLNEAIKEAALAAYFKAIHNV